MSPDSENHVDERVDRWADRYRSLVENANDGIYMVDAEGRTVSPNPAMADMYGYGVEEIEGMPVLDLHLPEDIPKAREALRRAERGGNVLERFSTRRKDGSQIWIEIKPVVIELMHRKFVFSITRDVTEGVLAEEALRASEERYRDIVENAFDVINSVDAEGNVIEANQKMADLLGFSRAEIARMNVRDFVVPEHLEAVLEHIAITVGHGLGQSLQCDWITREGRRVPVEINSTPRYSESGTFLVTRCIVRDISERRRLEAAFLQAQRMESVGRLAGGGLPMTSTTC